MINPAFNFDVNPTPTLTIYCYLIVHLVTATFAKRKQQPTDYDSLTQLSQISLLDKQHDTTQRFFPRLAKDHGIPEAFVIFETKKHASQYSSR